MADPFRDELVTLREKLLSLEDRIKALEHGEPLPPPPEARWLVAAKFGLPVLLLMSFVMAMPYVMGMHSARVAPQPVAIPASAIASAIAAVPSPDLQQAQKIAGFPHSVDAEAALPVVREAMALDDAWKLVWMEIRYVSPDGTVDLDAKGYDGHIAYEFVKPSPPDPNDQRPLGARNLDVNAKGTWVHLDRSGVHKSAVAGVVQFGRTKSTPEIAAAPRCAVAEVWKAAIAAHAPANGAVAWITFERHRQTAPGPARWLFHIDDVHFEASIDDRTCQLEMPALNDPWPPDKL